MNQTDDIKVLGFSTRTYNVLKYKHINTCEDLIDKNLRDILYYSNSGYSVIREIATNWIKAGHGITNITEEIDRSSNLVNMILEW